jgi:hypothetical protein
MALLGFALLLTVLFQPAGLSKWRSAAMIVLLPGMLISPWLIRNMLVFHGAAMFSTQSGFAAVAGVLVPQGRGIPSDAEKLKEVLGWGLPGDLETNDAIRNRLPTEPVLDRKCWNVAVRTWRELAWGLVPLTLRKLSYFWLSTDQLFWTGSFPRLQRAARVGGVFAYWGLLALAVSGWFQLRIRRPVLAQMFFLYALLVTIAHVPFNMNTRYRIPFIDPLVAVLAGVGVAAFVAGNSQANDTASLNCRRE